MVRLGGAVVIDSVIVTAIGRRCAASVALQWFIPSPFDDHQRLVRLIFKGVSGTNTLAPVRLIVSSSLSKDQRP
jgi:hypothetical protein